MPRIRTLILIFLLACVGFLVYLFPAAPVLARLEGTIIEGAPLRVAQVEGRLWEGRARVSWQEHAGTVRWQTDWHGMRPGMQATVRVAGLELSGWATGLPGHVTLEDVRVSAELASLSRGLSVGQAEGSVLGHIPRLRWYRDGTLDVAGTLNYGGGAVSWEGGGATVPPLDGKLYTEHNVAWLVVTDPDNTRVMDGRVESGEATLQVYRAWPRLLGVSQGGADDDVVFQVAQPLAGPPGG